MIGAAVGNYIVREKIGEGGMGAVYVAEHRRLGRRVAVKVLLPHLGKTPQIVARFFNEAKAATDIKNEHIVDVLDFGELEDGSSYIVMEWLEGQSLSELLAREGKLSVARTASIARGLAKALGAAHAHGIVHRDLKPDNIFLVTRDGQPDFVKVLDFGIAKLMLGDAGDVRTQAGAIMGTPYYMSPEQWNGATVDQRTDVYAMGIILYQMLTGEVPFSSTKITELVLAHATQKPPPLRERDPSISVAIESAVLQALEKDADRRFHSIDALANAFSSEASAPARESPRPLAASTAAEVFVRFGVRGKQSRLVLGLAGGIALALIAALALRRAPVVPPMAVGPSTAPAPATPGASGTTTDRWVLSKTDCLPGTMPKLVETTHDGSSFVSRSAGYPSVKGKTEPDGSFRIHSAGGTCTGKSNGTTVTETCTNFLHMSCHATYKRAD